jgi:hypothetical protein
VGTIKSFDKSAEGTTEETSVLYLAGQTAEQEKHAQMGGSNYLLTTSSIHSSTI